LEEGFYVAKIDFKKELKELYQPPAGRAVQVTVPQMQYAMAEGAGDPNTSEAFAQAMEALYGVSYTIRMMPKKGITPPGYYEYIVPPLEGIWDIAEGEAMFDPMHKDKLTWTVMIMQPDFVDNLLFATAKHMLKQKKKDNPYIDKVQLKDWEEGDCVQIMHIGLYDDEPESFSKMETYMEGQGLARTEKKHHEIYLSDPKRVAPEKRKTVLRVRVAPIS
jgi:hypothetical protein